MMPTRIERTRISQLTSTYSPDEPPRLALDFGDYLSLLWRLDQVAAEPIKVKYYRRCLQAVAAGLGIQGSQVVKLMELSAPGQLYEQLANVPYRSANRLLDAQDRKAAIAQMAQLRLDILRVGTYHDKWPVSWPGSGIMDTDLRERVFAVLFTALQGQYENFGRLLLVIDIVLSELLLGTREMAEVNVADLVEVHGYPNFNDTKVRALYYSDSKP
ncbi:MAG: hypothetical protein H6671_17245 [Anaerolineaceae bacterium]|nr:hypothetical protein [Anaerolineaceae bacterium]